MKTKLQKEIVEKARNLKKRFYLPITLSNGYVFNTHGNITMDYLYDNLVTVEEPELLSSSGSFLNTLTADIRKADEQTAIDVKDINPKSRNLSKMAKKIIRGANNKFLITSNFQKENEVFNHNRNAYGSAIFKKYTIDNKPIIKNIDPTKIFFNPTNFKDGYKMETFTKTPNQIINDERFDILARKKIRGKTDKEELDKARTFYIFFGKLDNMYLDKSIKGQSFQLHFLDLENELVLLSAEREEEMYCKDDRIKRQGFSDAWGIGMYEENANALYQDKISRESLNKILKKLSITAFAKQSTNEEADVELVRELEENGINDNDLILHTEGDIRTMDLINPNSEVSIYNHINSIQNFIQKNTGVTDTLRGDSNPSDSGIKVSYQLEAASTPFKRLQISYGEFLSSFYSKGLLKYIMDGLKKEEDISKWLLNGDLKSIEEEASYDMLARIEKDLMLYGTDEDREEYNRGETLQNIKENIETSKLITSDLLDEIKKEIKDIEIVVTGNRQSKAQKTELLFDALQRLDADPNYFDDPRKAAIYNDIAEENPSVDSVDLMKKLTQKQNG